jgi:hypothetical protein
MPESFLAPTDQRGLNQIRLWLVGGITHSDFFTRRPRHSLDDLQEALWEACKEIDILLDAQLFQLMAVARTEPYNIDVKDDDFFDGRKIDVDELRRIANCERLGRRQTVRCLKCE